MKLAKLAGALVVGLAASAAANADTLRFTATSESHGVLGFIEYDSSIFDTSNSFQLVYNTKLLNIDFTDPLTSLHVTTIGPSGDIVVFDSTGSTPAIRGGFGYVGGTDDSNGVMVKERHGVFVGTDYTDVNWSAAHISAVPEPENYALLLAGLGAVGFVARRRRA